MKYETFTNADGTVFLKDVPSSFDDSGVFGINPNLTRDQQGYVYWKGVDFEHVTFCPYGRIEKLTYECVAGIVAKCLMMESHGISVSWESYSRFPVIPLKEINIPGIGLRTVSTETAQGLLMDDDCEPHHDLAEAIDDGIYFYVADEVFFTQSDSEIAQHVLDNT